MIAQTYPSLRAPPPPTIVYPKNTYPYPVVAPSPSERMRAGKMNITVEEFVRRKDIVREQWRACNLHIGDLVFPKSTDDVSKYGKLRVVGVMGTYFDFPLDEPWPANDNPLIVHVEGVDKLESMNCTTNWLRATKE
jgi:hypothetical protein